MTWMPIVLPDWVVKDNTDDIWKEMIVCAITLDEIYVRYILTILCLVSAER